MRFALPAALLAAISLASVSVAQTADQPDFTAEGFRSHVAFLSDDLLEGRDAGTRGYDIAARYVATQFEGLGLKPGNGGSWYQEVPFGDYRVAEGSTLTIGGKAFPHNGDILLYPGADAQLSLEAPVVFAGYGLDAPERGFNDYAGLDVKGKIVAVLSGYPKGTASDVGAHLTSEKGLMAQKNGAVGMITIRNSAEMKRRSWNAVKANASHGNITWSENGKPYSAAPNIRFSATLDQSAAEDLFAGARTPLKTVLAQADKAGGKPKGFALKPSVKVEQQTTAKTFSSPNVLAVLPGSDPALANEYVLLMAHLDHVGTDPSIQGDQIHNGAMDNATGIATLIEVAEAMAASPNRPKRPILFAAVTAEEDGLRGSQFLAKHPVLGNGKVVGVVNLDMPVLTYDFQDVIAFGAEHSTMGQAVARAGASMGVKLIDDPLPQEGLFTRSDHYRFVQEGIPSVFLMTGFGGEGQERFMHFLQNDYHKPSDEIDLPFNWQAGAKFARINYLIAREIADGAEAPRWYRGSFFGDVFAKDQPKAAPVK
ncbi:M28 family metallopeptidase [Allosphingosinicella vermicomposti]|uniref:M28 family metallopeptidase n=1 Tax=Allosphingosinicella vermicomposti TaxID=614671 RepID=UPI0018F8A32E|nr:M28 family metallopeptidase [Allosphingosinicella vermicomposti]